MTDPPRNQTGAALFLTIGWLVAGVYLAVQGNVIGVLACLVGSGIMAGTYLYVRKHRKSG